MLFELKTRTENHLPILFKHDLTCASTALGLSTQSNCITAFHATTQDIMLTK